MSIAAALALKSRRAADPRMAAPAIVPQELHVLEEGSGPPVLLLHGLGGDHTVWNAQFRALAERYRVLAPDLRGHGRSACPEGSSLGFDEIVADLRALLDARGLPSAHVAGISAGAFVALYWATREPSRLRSVILSGGATHCDAHTREVGRNWRETYTSEGFDAFLLRLVKDLYAAEWIEANMDVIDRLRQELRGRDFRAAFRWGQAVERYDLRGRLGGLKLPLLALHGLDDRVVDSSHARLLRQSITGTQVRLFPLTGHMVPVERPAETLGAIRDWLDAHELPVGGNITPSP